MPQFTWQQSAVLVAAIAGVVIVLYTRSAEAGAIAVIVQAFLPSVLKGKQQ